MELWIGIRGKYHLPIFAVEYVVLVMVPTNVNIPPGQERCSLFRDLLLLQHLASGLGGFDLEVGHMTNACMVKGEVDF